jgi:hypothetical protein
MHRAATCARSGCHLDVALRTPTMHADSSVCDARKERGAQRKADQWLCGASRHAYGAAIAENNGVALVVCVCSCSSDIGDLVRRTMPTDSETPKGARDERWL